MSGVLTSIQSTVGSISAAINNLTPPPSQKYRTIGFVLAGGTGGSLNFTFNIRPDDLRRSEPSRASVQQTLGGALLDSFGAAISTITLSGNNGWRGNAFTSGEGLFAALREAVFVQWHKRRQQQIAAGADPNAVTLTFVDTLDKITVQVVPMSFTLNRSKSQPLLMRYSIELTVLKDAAAGAGGSDGILAALSDPLRWLASVTGLGNVLGQIQSGLATVQSYYAAAQSYIGPFMSTLTNVLAGVRALTSLASPGGLLGGAIAPVLTTGLLTAQAGANLFHALAAQPGQTSQQTGAAINMAQQCLDAACLIGNGFAVGQIYRSFDAMFGASACSSTGGGSDWSIFTLANANPFESLFASPTAVPDMTVSASAQAGLSTLTSDVLLLSQRLPAAAAAAGAVASGITVAPSLLAAA